MTRPIIDEQGSKAREREVRVPSASGNRWIIIGVLALLGISVLIYTLLPRAKQEMAGSSAENSPSGTVQFRMEQQWLIRMKLAQAGEQTVARQVASTGRVIPAANSQAIIAPPVGGVIQGGQLPRIGQPVSKGQVIAVLQQTATSADQAQVHAQNAQVAIENARLEAECRVAAGDVESARIRFDLANTEAERARRLHDQKAFALRQLQAAEAERDATKAAYQAAVQRRDALSAAHPVELQGPNAVGANASYAVHAPLSGYVTKVNKSIGERVAPGEAIVEVTNLDTVWVEAPIFERDLSRLRRNRPATFTTFAYPGQEFRGAVVDIGAVINEQTRAATVIFQIPNAGRQLLIGMQANVRLDAGEVVTAVMIPKEAVLETEGKKAVYVLVSGEEFQRREVTVGDEYGDRVAVLSGLKPGERIVTQGAYQIRMQELRPASAGAHTHET